MNEEGAVRRDGWKKTASAALVVLGCLCLGVAWKYGWNDSQVTMDYRLPAVEVNAVEVPGAVGSVDLEPYAGEGSRGSVAYSEDLFYNPDTGMLSLVFQNPQESRVGMVLGVEVDGRVLWQSGLLGVGYGVESVPMEDPGLDPGIYDCALVVDHYDLATGEKAMVSIRIEAQLTVSEGMRTAGIS